MSKCESKCGKKLSRMEAFRLREDAFDGIVSISDDFGVLASRGQNCDSKGNPIGLSFPTTMDKRTAALDTLRMILEEENDITGIVMFTASKKKGKHNDKD